MPFKFDQPIASHSQNLWRALRFPPWNKASQENCKPFVESIRSGTKPDASIEHATHAMAVLHAVREAFETGQTVDVEPIE
jgi:predicted dehydrogenase